MKTILWITFSFTLLIQSVFAIDNRTLGLRFYDRWQADSTLSLLLPIYKENPQDDSVALAVAEASLWKKDIHTTSSIIANLKNPLSGDALRIHGMLFLQAGRLAEALQMFDRAIPKLNKPWGAMEQRALALAWLKRFEEAIQQAQKVTASKEASIGIRVRTHIHLATWYSWQKQWDLSKQEIAKALQLDKSSVDAYLQLGQIQEWLGNYHEAKESYGKILSIQSNHAEARLRLNKLHWVK